tara:strand:+ start:262 stop:654 length:393 start_codon:yes stop_codon:yes gene_type:complete
MAYRDEVYWIERDKIAIAKLDRTATSISSEFTGPDAGKVVTVFAVKYDSNFGDTDSVTNKIGPTESPNIPVEFHESLIYKVLERLYSANLETVQLATYWNSRFEASVIEAKRYANIGRDGAAPKIKPAEY